MYKRLTIKTLSQAQKAWPDALQAKCSHDPYRMTWQQMTGIGEKLTGRGTPSKVLFVKVGKGVSTVISSRQAQIDFERQITSTKAKNSGLTPYINKEYYCETCGSRSGECHPDTGMCFICDADDWRPVNE
ncbi:MAG: hypothetical protein LBU80_01085 [Rikenellaceae bacterium]|jgi:Zn finger protein HypA/HybF involved in hydrogenase expression|nr:hypothetical protein [Rikenellaceae bacterium]